MTAPTDTIIVAEHEWRDTQARAAERDAYRDRALLIAAVCVLLLTVICGLIIIVVALGG